MLGEPGSGDARRTVHGGGGNLWRCGVRQVSGELIFLAVHCFVPDGLDDNNSGFVFLFEPAAR